MATGYTAPVQSGEVDTLEAFALRCARAFGALVMMRDDPMDAPIPERIDFDTSFHDKELAAAEARLAELATMSPHERERAADLAHSAELDRWERRVSADELTHHRYSTMLAKVEAWAVPDDLAKLRSFMIEQLVSSMEFDCAFLNDPPPKPLAADEWHAAEVTKATWSRDYHTEQRAKAAARAADATRWLDQLRASVKEV